MKKVLLFIFVLAFVGVVALAQTSANSKGTKGGGVTQAAKVTKTTKATKAPKDNKGNNRGEMPNSTCAAGNLVCILTEDNHVYSTSGYYYWYGSDGLNPYSIVDLDRCSNIGGVYQVIPGEATNYEALNDDSGRCGMIRAIKNCIPTSPSMSVSLAHGIQGQIGCISTVLECVPRDCEAIVQQYPWWMIVNGQNSYAFAVNTVNNFGPWHLAGQNDIGIDPCTCMKGNLSATAHTTR